MNIVINNKDTVEIKEFKYSDYVCLIFYVILKIILQVVFQIWFIIGKEIIFWLEPI